MPQPVGSPVAGEPEDDPWPSGPSLTSHRSFTPDELASVRREYRAASLLPKRTYHDAGIFDWERRRDPSPGLGPRRPRRGCAGPRHIPARRGRRRGHRRGARPGRSQLRAFYNVCRHRGTAVVEEGGVRQGRALPSARTTPGSTTSKGKLIRAKHTEDLDAFSFEGLQPGLGPASRPGRASSSSTSVPGRPVALRRGIQLGDLVESTWSGSSSPRLRSAKRTEYEVGANWKLIAENYSECYHCPGVHPQLNRLTPYDLGERLRARTGHGRVAGWSWSAKPRRWRSTAATARAPGGRRCPGMGGADERADLLLRPVADDVHLDPP